MPYCAGTTTAQIRKLTSAARAHAGMRRARAELERTKCSLQDQLAVLQQDKGRLELELRQQRRCTSSCDTPTMRVELIGHFKPCMTGIYLPI